MGDIGKRTCVILGAMAVSPAMKREVPSGAFVIAADAGYRNLAPLGLAPDILLGDWDSAPAPEACACEIVTLPHEKDDTDTHFAARIALERGFDRVIILGGLGGRLDHTLANMHTLLFLARAGVDAVLTGEENRAVVALPGAPAVLDRGEWKYFSVFTLASQSTGVAIAGGLYPLFDATLTPDFPLGVSNEFAAEQAVVSVQDGALLVLCQKE